MDLPPCPPGFDIEIHDLEDFDSRLPLRRPRTATYVVGVEWSSAPAHAQMDDYYLSTDRKRTTWYLWLSCYNEWDESDRCSVWASGPRPGVPAAVAAVHLLRAAWRKHWGFSTRRPWFAVTGAGLLGRVEIEAIVDELWPKA